MKAWRIPLLPLGWLYGAVVRLRGWLFDAGILRSQRLSIPVISLGNITVGGTGKTPMAEFLLQQLLAMGLRPGYLSRGYGRGTTGYLRVDPAAGDASRFGDEALQVARKLPTVPVAVCEDRVTGGRRLLAEAHIDILVLDDAFQHRRIGRDLDWVMVDATRLPVRDALLPAGRLREGISGLRRAHALVVTKYADAADRDATVTAMQAVARDLPVATMRLAPKAVVEVGATERVLGLECLKGRRAVLLSGIGNPGHFEDMARELGVEVVMHLAYADHHAYSAQDCEKILSALESQTEIKGKLPPALLLTTEKDLARMRGMPWMARLAQVPMAYLQVGMVPDTGWGELELQLKKIIKVN